MSDKETTPPLVTVFGASRTTADTVDWREAHALGAALAERGFGVVTGGYGGSMEAVSAGAASTSRPVPIVGVTVPEIFRDRPGANRFVTREVQATSLLRRIEHMLEGSVAAVALPGSVGTFTEVMVAWNLAFVARFGGRGPRPVVTVGPVWRDLCDRVVQATATDPELVICVDTVGDVMPTLDRLL